MKKLFTLIAAVMLGVLSMNAADYKLSLKSQDLNQGWSGSYNEVSQTITFEEANDQCGWTLGKTGVDLSSYDQMVVKFSDPLPMQVMLVVEYAEDAGADMAAEQVTANAGEKSVTLNLDSRKKPIARIYFQALAAGKVVLKDAYLTLEDKTAAYKLSLEDGVTDGICYEYDEGDYEPTTKTITLPNTTSQCGWMFTMVGKDFSAYDSLIIKTEPLATGVTLRVVYGEGADMSTEATLVKKGATELSLEMDSEKKQIVQILVEAVEANTSVVLKSAYLTPATSTGISSAAIAPAKNADTRVFNLAGQQVDKAYKGIVIKNGKKYVQK